MYAICLGTIVYYMFFCSKKIYSFEYAFYYFQDFLALLVPLIITFYILVFFLRIVGIDPTPFYMSKGTVLIDTKTLDLI